MVFGDFQEPASKRELRSILVVEDEWVMANHVAQTLASNGYRVVGPANSVETALAAMADIAIDAALLDIHLGRGQTAFELGRILKAQRIPFAFLTGYSRALMPLDLRDSARVPKPFAQRDVLQVLEELRV